MVPCLFEDPKVGNIRDVWLQSTLYHHFGQCSVWLLPYLQPTMFHIV